MDVYFLTGLEAGSLDASPVGFWSRLSSWLLRGCHSQCAYMGQGGGGEEGLEWKEENSEHTSLGICFWYTHPVLLGPHSVTGIPRFTVLCFIKLHRRCVFYKLKARTSTSKMITTRFIAILPLLWCSGTENVQNSPGPHLTLITSL